MWIVFAIVAMVFEASEHVVDKIAMVGDKAIDSLSATFLRTFIFWLWFALIGATGLLGVLRFFVPWPIFAIAILLTGSAILYTHLLKNIEVTASSAIGYVTPCFYLLIDVAVFKVHLGLWQVLGILLLVSGGTLFAIDPKRLAIRSEFTLLVWGIFVWNILVGGVEYYLFKYYVDSYALNEVSWFFNIWILMSIGLFVAIFLLGKVHSITAAARSRGYLKKIILSKGLDAVYAGLWFHAVGIAAVSQVSAAGALSPLILLGVVYLAQEVFGFKAEEKLADGRLMYKLGAILLLCAGGYLVS